MMQWYRIANFISQTAYLTGHFFFLLWFLRKRQAGPVWRLFIAFSISLWLWVSGRFLETIVYLFFPADNAAYVFAANYQYIGITTAGVFYFVWVLYLTGHDKLAESWRFKSFFYSYPIITCTLIFTNEHHHLIYTKLTMGERVEHGILFKPVLLFGYLIMLAGYALALLDILKTEQKKKQKILLFSTFPLLPAGAVLVRSFSGIDLLDYTPIVMAIAYWCVYLAIFKYNYVNIIPASIEAIVEQTIHPIGIYDSQKKTYVYRNQAAVKEHSAEMELFVKAFPPVEESQDAAEYAAPLCREKPFPVGKEPFQAKEQEEKEMKGTGIALKAFPLPDASKLLIAGIDDRELNSQMKLLEEQIRQMKVLSLRLEEENRNIDAYLGSLYEVEGIKRKQEEIDKIYKLIYQSFQQQLENFYAIRQNPEQEGALLRENLLTAESCMKEIRATVAILREP